MRTRGPGAVSNAVLKQIEPDVLSAAAGHFHIKPMTKGEVLQEAGEDVTWVYFPESGLISLATETPFGETVESALIGAEGVLGAFEACGSRRAYAQAHVQIPGETFRIRAADYRELFQASNALRIQIHKQIEMLLVQARQYVACNALHSVEARLSRALLDAFDRSGDLASIPLTQEALAHILGVQRTTIAVAMSNLQREGALRTGRASIEIVDYARLERFSCPCRATLLAVEREIRSSTTEVCET
ncbi:Crp/Fnr family transcriptional regulator [Caulobacter sp. S45]|uniref:Crp/Fnr family transcriptional regulator n=1 Tax=Caulobacter sp. S45 TaxID=1641861 RepID=UPI00131CD9B4|nr:Crp/Fnr family transcriptional regulator [Caulobacter sp. S45]